ncbi:MAG: rhomboid family intramembrane serine protease [Candidatus Yanofskybacteria bacterium RIFCSPHIGHO2_02_FULL_38_22b]|uniref:Rhomboid family intramembrane serine protease n=1 Tax=Candidatus Yanofskybacteria bacterium RIFCSPHIGHO2_02_FULL_38_22b TaxID=1802673 RepID=A0A1F8F2J5_9BACT|nr:MAG: rhomboid family intramembrane serine protease [Candidatus Yanofskybacteria bacterium RIFCSPHIGHO2_01_FULL_39_44]OGN06908.1 MAG: rhomboid family intramembrane serine protease [Candidatus Yanofskybacteria bacterium RIFCSPHIGHO2_02_FULL_38_22b]OGN20688.1 MAG: rhomboid family intramembrane serine protease [Candidatus Yanofskybacteria bacterium RIFCSPLOWO2_01_FULL_39_28]
MTIRFNSPVILTFALISAGVLVLFTFTGTTFYHLFSAPTEISLFSPFMYFSFVSHVFGHQNWNHLLSNFMIILLVGPLVEEKYSSGTLFLIILITALITGILNIVLFSTSLMGASGIAFMLIILASLTNFSRREIPLTFLLVAGIFLGNEVINSIEKDNISQFAHIVGGICGSSFGLLFAQKD